MLSTLSATVALAHPAAVLAHQGGWDEILLIAAPIVGIGVLLRIAKRRVDRMQPPGTSTDAAASASGGANGGGNGDSGNGGRTADTADDAVDNR